MKFKIPLPARVTLFKRHRGPYSVMLGEYHPTLRQMRTKMSKLRFVRAEDVDKYCQQMVDEEEFVFTASVFSARDGYWIVTYTKQPDLQEYVDQKEAEWNARFEREEVARGRHK